MTRRPLRRGFLALLMLGLLAAAGLGVSGGIASGRQAAEPRSAKKPQRPTRAAETLPACLKTLASDRAQASDLKRLRQDVLAKRTYLYTIGRFQGQPLFVPLSVVEFKYFLSEQLILGKIRSSQALQLVQQIKQMTADNLVFLKQYIALADDIVQRQKRRCDALRNGSKPKPPPPSGTTFTLQPSLTKVTNTHAPELTIDATGMSARENHCCDGGGWKVDYSWEVPQVITPGKSIQITLTIRVESVNPNQPVGFQMNALAPDFAQAIQAHWPDTPTSTKTFTVPIAADQKDSSDFAITIGFVSSGVTYHYRK